ncbi:MAG TPA: ABC transporter ATP-binding protein [Bacteroidota bacterium]|nr:ABC transporter ATP-binding protein [Bacteroidota bacterium]
MRPLLRLKPYLLRYRRTLMYGILTVVGSNLFTIVQPKFLGYAVDELKHGIESKTLVSSDLLMWAGFIVLFAFIAGIFTYLTRQTIIVMSRHIEYDLRNDLLSHLQKLPYSYFQNTPTGDLMAHATNDISSVRNALGPGIMYPTDTSMTLILVLIMMFTSDWQLTLLTLIPMPFVSLAMYRLGKVINKKFMERQEQFSTLTTQAQETLSGIRVVKSYVREEFEEERFRKLSWNYLKKNLELAQAQAIIWPLMFVLIGLSLVITIYFGGLKVISGSVSIGTLTAFTAYLSMLIWPMIALGWVTNILQQGAASMERIGIIFDKVPDIQNSGATDTSIKEIEGTIEFKNVSFTHKDAAQPTLKNIDLKIERGTTLAIVGYTGSGKSTLVNLLPRLYDTSAGSLLIDGNEIRTIPLEVLRANIGFVPQETFLFSDTIAENIRYGVDGSTEEELENVADIAQIAKDISEFPKHYGTTIGERGITLSGGQKQRTSIARAVMRRPKILILDDALSAVDTYTEERVLQRLREFMKDRTSIIISHRISTVKDAQMIIVLQNGSIVERGTHNELVALNGIYADLHNKQLLEQELEQL